MNFVDPKNDVAFNKIFGDENKKQILISFLNHILDYAGTDKEIASITRANPFQVPRIEGLKYSILDIKALDKRGIHYFIKIQFFRVEGMDKRILFKIINEDFHQLNKSEDYPKLNQVIFIGFLDFVFFKNNPDYASRHLILDEKTHVNHFRDFELYFIELPKFNKTLEELKDIKEKWIYFVKNVGDMEVIPEKMKQPEEMLEAFEAANQYTWTSDELEAYDAKGIFIADQRQGYIYAQKTGHAEGIEEGIEIGEKNKAIAIARKLKEKGSDIDFISETTGLEKEIILGL